MKLYLSLIFSVLLFCPITSAEEKAYVGHWRSGMSAASEDKTSASSVADLFVNEDGSFRWKMKFTLPGGRSHNVDKAGSYRIEDDRLLLFYETSPKNAQTWRFKVEDDTFWLIDKSGIEKIPYRRVSETAKETKPATPAEVALAFYKACGEVPLDYDKLNALRSEAALMEEKSLPADIQKLRRGAFERVGGNGTQKEVVLLQERVDGDKAYVDVEIRYTTSTSAKFNAELVRENNKWKLKD